MKKKYNIKGMIKLPLDYEKFIAVGVNLAGRIFTFSMEGTEFYGVKKKIK